MITTLLGLAIGCFFSTLFVLRLRLYRSNQVKVQHAEGVYEDETDPLLGRHYERRKASFSILEPSVIQLLRHGLRISLIAASLAADRNQPPPKQQYQVDSRKRRRGSPSPIQTARSSIRRKITKEKSSHMYLSTSPSSSSPSKPSLQQLFDLPSFPSAPSPQTPSSAVTLLSNQELLINPSTSILIDGDMGHRHGKADRNVKLDDVAREHRRPSKPTVATRHRSGKSWYNVNDVALDPIILPSGLARSSFQEESIFELTVPALGRMKLIEHAPLIFIKLREACNLSHDELCTALARPFTLQRTEGQSGSFFLTSSNRKLLFKTLRGSEHENLKNFLPAYLNYLSKNPNSLLPRYFGCYTFEKLSGGERVLSASSLLNGGTNTLDLNLGSKFTIIAMLSVYDTDLDIHQKFDFKGSNVGRQAIQGLMSCFVTPSAPSSTLRISNESLYYSDAFRNSEITLKELDFRRLVAMGKADLLRVGVENKRRLLYQLEQDLSLLKSHYFMDYSLLVGVHRRRRSEVLDTMVSTSTNNNGTLGSHRKPVDSWPRRHSAYSSIRSIRSVIPHQAASFFMWLLGGPSNTSLSDQTPSSAFSSLTDEDDSPVDERLAFHRRFHGGLKSIDSEKDELEYEVYFIGLIDILQKFNLAKWLERGFKRQASFLTSADTWRVGDLTMEAASLLLSRSMQSENGIKSPTPAFSPTSPTLRTMSPLPVWDGVEHSVEEPQRYASRLLEYVRSILQ